MLVKPHPKTAFCHISVGSPFFDIVIFDEASQCYSEKSIPAIARGKQVLVVGG